MRKAGDILEGNSETQALMRQAINAASDSFAPEVVQQISSHHVDIDRGVEGFINDGSPKSYLHKGGHVIDGSFDKYKMPLPGQPAGAKELRQLDPRELERYDNIFEHQKFIRQGTGNLV